jgi:hypothetical protein
MFFLTTTTLLLFTTFPLASPASDFIRVEETMFIAALGDPTSSKGTGASKWGIWHQDPGPRGVSLHEARQLLEAGQAPMKWSYDNQVSFLGHAMDLENEFWVEEHGLIMETPTFPLTSLGGRFVVTGGRDLTTILTVEKDGDTWSLAEGTLHDITHLPCRSAKYTPDTGTRASLLNAKASDFPVTPGGVMPDIKNCARKDYWVLFVVGLEKVETPLKKDKSDL